MHILKRIKQVLFVMLLTGTVTAQEQPVYLFSYFKGNGEDGLHLAYSTDGYRFKALNNDKTFLKPELSKDKLMRDPCIIRGKDGLFHMVWTVSWNDRGIGYASSADLIHWSRQLYIPVMQHEPQALNCWAPEITYDKKTDLYYIYWATTIPGRFAATDSTGDGNNNHRMYFVSTSDFKTFSPAKLLLDPGFNVIDATIQPDGNRYIMFLKNETKRPVPEKNLRIATSGSISSGYKANAKPITGKYWAEGPTAIKINEKWIVYFDKYMEHKYGAVESADLVNWKDVSEKISFPDGIRHGTVFAISSKEFRRFFPGVKL